MQLLKLAFKRETASSPQPSLPIEEREKDSGFAGSGVQNANCFAENSVHMVMEIFLSENRSRLSPLSWILRPFIGAPGLPVEFLRSTAFKGNFYETVANSFLGLFSKP